MRIGINLLYLTPGLVGGTQTYTECMMDAFAKVGSDHEFIVFLNLDCKDHFLDLPENFTKVLCNISGKVRPLRVMYEQCVLPRLVVPRVFHAFSEDASKDFYSPGNRYS